MTGVGDGLQVNSQGVGFLIEGKAAAGVFRVLVEDAIHE